MNVTYYTVNEIALLLKVSYMTVYRWIKMKKLRAYQLQKQYRVKELDLQKFINDRSSI